MFDTRLGRPRAGASAGGPPASPDSAALHLGLLSELARVAVWELRMPGPDLVWHVPLDRILPTQAPGPYWLPAVPVDDGAPALREVPGEELGEALLAPIVQAASAGMVWGNYELVQEVLAPDGTGRQLMVRAISVPDPDAARFFGLVAEVTGTDHIPWMTADLARRLQLLVEHSPDGVIVHQDGVIVYANDAAARIAGLESAQAVLGQHLTGFLHRDHIAPVIARLGQLRQPGDVVKGHEVLMVRPDGTEVPVEVSSVRTTWGNKPAFQVVFHDLTERRQAEQASLAQQALERRYAAAVAVLEEGVVLLDRRGEVCGANESGLAILGSRLATGIGDDIFTGGGPVRRADGSPFPPDELPVRCVLGSGRPVSSVVLGVTGHGAVQWLSVSARPLADEAEAGAAVVCSVADITERKELVDRLAWEARNDPLTGLTNRTGFLTALEGALDEPEPGGALFVVDLDRFKLINDSLGHSTGDDLLRAVAERLRSAATDSAVVGRLHGDEFAVLEATPGDVDGMLQRAEELRAAVSQPIRLPSGRTLTITPAIGVAPLSGAERDAAGLLQDADMAMLQAKGRGRGRVSVFDAGLRDELGDRIELEDDLRAAISRDELHLVYQPIAALDSDRILGLEALVRWQHPTRGLLLPGRFVSMAEESDLIVDLGRWVLAAGCRQMARWRREHPSARDAFLAVNVSPRQLDGDLLVPMLHQALEQSGLPASALVLEITESGFVADDAVNQAVFEELRTVGVRLAIDDFGTGYSSLSYLKRLPVSYLKIDHSFVAGLGENEEDERIVAAITDLGHGLGLRVIAEGVESAPQREAAQRLRCDLYQGYLLARPQPVERIAGTWGRA